MRHKLFGNEYFVDETNRQVDAPIPAADVGEEVLRSLRRILRAVDQHGRRLARLQGLTNPQLLCLREIRRNGPMNPGVLARSVSLSPATVTGILDRLEDRGLATRRRRNRDKRQVLVQLTEAGEGLLVGTPQPLQERFLERFESLPKERRHDVADVLEEVVAMLEAEDIDAAPLLSAEAAHASEPTHYRTNPGSNEGATG